MFCIKCGTKNPDDARFCSNCGCRFDRTVNSEKKNTDDENRAVSEAVGWSKERARFLIFWLSLIIIIANVILYLFS